MLFGIEQDPFPLHPLGWLNLLFNKTTARCNNKVVLRPYPLPSPSELVNDVATSWEEFAMKQSVRGGMKRQAGGGAEEVHPKHAYPTLFNTFSCKSSLSNVPRTHRVRARNVVPTAVCRQYCFLWHSSIPPASLKQYTNYFTRLD